MLFLGVMLFVGCGDTNTDGSTPGSSDGSGDGSDSGSSGESPDAPDSVEGALFGSGSNAVIVMGEGAERDQVVKIRQAFMRLYGYQPRQVNQSFEKSPVEIVIGRSEREISKKAYAELERLGEISGPYVRYLIYAESGSIAIAFSVTDATAKPTTAQSYAVADFIRVLEENSKKEFKRGVALSGTVDLLPIEKAEDQRLHDLAWKHIYDALEGVPNRDGVYAAIENYYTLYDTRLVSWYANLYDPSIGGYYYSNSARDNAQFLPDAESTCQALNLFGSSGMCSRVGDLWQNGIPEIMKEEIGRFIKGLQKPNGFFYHPQWTVEAVDARISRRSRDLSWCTGILYALGLSPTYDSPNGMKGDGLLYDGTPAPKAKLTRELSASSVALASSVVLSASYAEHLENDVTFKEYLEKLLRDNSGGLHFYYIGNQLTSEMPQIKERDKQLLADGADYSLVDILIKWLNSHQNPENGLWESTSGYLGVNGLLKISGIYSAAGVEIPYGDLAAKSAIEAITSKEQLSAVVDIYNTWYAALNVFDNMLLYGKTLEIDGVKLSAAERVEAMRKGILEDAVTYINATREKLSIFQKSDGSFSYHPNMTSSSSQGMPVALPINEGDVNATGICSNGTTGLMFEVLGLPRPPLFGEVDRIRYMEIISAKRRAQNEK